MNDDDDDKLSFAQPPSQLDEDAFMTCFGAVCEHSPWVAQKTWRRGLGPGHDTVAGLSAAFARTLVQAERTQQLALIRAHPDLAGRAAVRAELTEDSTNEQASAGLDQCTNEEFERFRTLNQAYKTKFGFPFIMAVRGSDRQAILAAFEQRLDNDAAAEFERALSEINKIVRLRLQQLAAPRLARRR